MINRTDLRKVRQMEYFQVMATIKRFLEAENLTELGLESLKPDFDTALDELDKALKGMKKSEYTEVISELDHKRDMFLVGFIEQCNLYLDFPVEEVAQAAKKILPVIEKYGKNPQTRPLQEETGIIVNLLQDLETSDLKQAVEKMRAKEWIDALRDTNDKFIVAYERRIEEQGGSETGKAKEKREEMQKVFVKLCKRINALSEINGVATYKNIINNINETVKKALS